MTASRRNVLAATVSGSTLGLAGCGDLAGSDGTPAEQTGDGGSGPDDGGEARVTIALAVQEKIQEAREEIGTRVQEGNLSQEDGQAEFQDARDEIISTAIEDLRAYVADTDGLAVENTNEQAAAALVNGPAAAVVAMLDTELASALLSGSDFPTPQES